NVDRLLVRNVGLAGYLQTVRARSQVIDLLGQRPDFLAVDPQGETRADSGYRHPGALVGVELDVVHGVLATGDGNGRIRRRLITCSACSYQVRAGGQVSNRTRRGAAHELV